ncbi:hypothetical protein NNQ27_22775 (plasmid) [Cronobacter dublinensis subsp. infanticibi]|uniref:hypothetical protein n=1 Tax=Cronobacter dublinensis TaxID=413497 RepID=UPI0023DD288F|nr:hypothetical protein [Cronobacter dublinensis]WEP47721.1 hypothetical protein NNQ27_22775 [Cronobacter dublinensis]
MAKSPQEKPKEVIQAGFDDVKKAYKKGAQTVNNTYAPQAGRDLQSGNGELMATYRRNKKAIDKLDTDD